MIRALLWVYVCLLAAMAVGGTVSNLRDETPRKEVVIDLACYVVFVGSMLTYLLAGPSPVARLLGLVALVFVAVQGGVSWRSRIRTVCAAATGDAPSEPSVVALTDLLFLVVLAPVVAVAVALAVR